MPNLVRMPRAINYRDDQLPEVNVLLKQTTAQRSIAPQIPTLRSCEKQDFPSTTKRRVRRLESGNRDATNHLFRPWNVEEDAKAPKSEDFSSGESTFKQPALPPRRSRSNKPVASSRQIDATPPKESGLGKACIKPHQDVKWTLNAPASGEPLAKISSAQRLVQLQESGSAAERDWESSEGEATSQTRKWDTKLKHQAEDNIDAETSDEESPGEYLTAEDDLSEYDDDDRSECSSDDSFQIFEEHQSRQTSRSPQTQPRSDQAASKQPNKVSREPRPSVQNPQRNRKTEIDNFASEEGSLRGRAATWRLTFGESPSSGRHDTLNLVEDLSRLRLSHEEDSDDHRRHAANQGLKGPCLTPTKKHGPNGLTSPRKQAFIPQTPHRPSIDLFWSQEFVDDWNDQHSPRKPSHAEPPARKPTGAKLKLKETSKKETKKTFAARKDQIAREFLVQLDHRITQGKITELAAATGGVKIVWSRTLNTTAGRANWRRETVHTTSTSEMAQGKVEFKHHASIELAEKVIDEEDRLLNVLAHEFCHLANFMINGVTNNPHGKEFKAWAAKCSSEFADQGIKVTTKHTYEIDFKYVWTCDACKSQYKRHSKSIDPSRHRCGSCKGQLTQTKPVPRGSGAGARPSEYTIFMREQMKIIRRENPGSPQKDVMKMVADRWSKREKGSGNSEEEKSSGIVRKLEL